MPDTSQYYKPPGSDTTYTSYDAYKQNIGGATPLAQSANVYSPTPVNTSTPQPSPTNPTPTITPTVPGAPAPTVPPTTPAPTTGQVTGTLPGQTTPTTFQSADIAKQYGAALTQAQASGPAPQTQAGAAPTVQNVTAPITNANNQNQNNAVVANTLAQDPGYQKLMADAKAANDVVAQQKSLLDTYKQMEADAGLSGINTQLLNTQKIINGTEDDIRSEVQAASGFATDSQVLAMASARNKTLIQNYNNLLAQKQQAEDHINTMIQLAGTDRQNAIQAANNQLNIDGQLLDYQQKFIQNAKEGYNNVLQAVGYSGLVNSLLNTDPTGKSLAQAEQTLGFQPGQLQNIATQEQSAKNLAIVQASGLKTPYVVTASGEVWNSQTGQAYTSQQDFQAKTGMSTDQAGAKGMIGTMSQSSGLTSKDTQTVTAGGRVLLINSITGQVIQDLGASTSGSGPGGPTPIPDTQPDPTRADTPGYNAQGVKYTNSSAFTEVNNTIKSDNLRGSDGYISPASYEYYKSWWVQNGLKAADFDAEFGQYINPAIKTQYL